MNVLKSKLNGLPLHVIFDATEIENARAELTSVQDALSVSVVNITETKIVGPHKHEGARRVTDGSVEVWIVLDGVGLAQFYDTDGTLLLSQSLHPKMIVVTLNGGHALKASNLLMVEIKNGPYINTKVPINVS